MIFFFGLKPNSKRWKCLLCFLCVCISFRQRHRNRRTSDNESELSRGSGRSHNSHRKRRHRSRHRRTESGSENEGSRRSFSGHRKSTGSMDLLDPNQSWRDAQRRRNDCGMNSSIKSETDYNGSHKGRRHRKNRYFINLKYRLEHIQKNLTFHQFDLPKQQ